MHTIIITVETCLNHPCSFFWGLYSHILIHLNLHVFDQISLQFFFLFVFVWSGGHRTQDLEGVTQALYHWTTLQAWVRIPVRAPLTTLLKLQPQELHQQPQAAPGTLTPWCSAGPLPSTSPAAPAAGCTLPLSPPAAAPAQFRKTLTSAASEKGRSRADRVQGKTLRKKHNNESMSGVVVHTYDPSTCETERGESSLYNEFRISLNYIVGLYLKKLKNTT